MFRMVSRSVVHPAERTTYNAVTIPRFFPWNQLIINQSNEQQLTDLLALDNLTSNVEKRFESTLSVNVSISESHVNSAPSLRMSGITRLYMEKCGRGHTVD